MALCVEYVLLSDPQRRDPVKVAAVEFIGEFQELASIARAPNDSHFGFQACCRVEIYATHLLSTVAGIDCRFRCGRKRD